MKKCGAKSTPKILFNGLLYEKKGAGISVYTKKLIDAYLTNETLDINCLVRKQFKEDYSEEDKVCLSTKPIYNSKQRILYEQIKGIKQYNQYNLIHFPDYAIPLMSKAKKIITVQDMAMFTMKEAYTRKQVLVKQFLLKCSLKRVDGIVCSSHYAKQELLRYFPYIKTNIEVIYPGVDEPKYKPLDEENKASVLHKFNISKPYILFVGTLAPSKNILNLIKGFELIRKQGLDYQLVICGKKGWMYEDLFKVYQSLDYKKDIIFTDFIRQEELETLYAEAKLFSSASLYEGFGFPPLEAMIRKVPVVVSDIEIFRETCEDAALYYNPTDIEDMARVLKQVLRNNDLQQHLIKEGYKRAKQFKTEETVKRLYAFYERVLNENNYLYQEYNKISLGSSNQGRDLSQ